MSLLATRHSVPETKVLTLAVSVCTILLLIGIEHFAPKTPVPLVAVAAGISGAYFLQLSRHSVDLVGRIPQGLPSLTCSALEKYPLFPKNIRSGSNTELELRIRNSIVLYGRLSGADRLLPSVRGQIPYDTT